MLVPSQDNANRSSTQLGRNCSQAVSGAALTWETLQPPSGGTVSCTRRSRARVPYWHGSLPGYGSSTTKTGSWRQRMQHDTCKVCGHAGAIWRLTSAGCSCSQQPNAAAACITCSRSGLTESRPEPKLDAITAAAPKALTHGQGQRRGSMSMHSQAGAARRSALLRCNCSHTGTRAALA